MKKMTTFCDYCDGAIKEGEDSSTLDLNRSHITSTRTNTKLDVGVAIVFSITIASAEEGAGRTADICRNCMVEILDKTLDQYKDYLW